MHDELHPPRSATRRRQGGTSQNTRLLAALVPAAAPVDGRTEAEMLVWAAGLGKVVHFFDQQNRIDGNWAPFFESEPIVQYSRISRQDMIIRAEMLRSQLHTWKRPVAPENAVLAEGSLLSLLYEQCQRINRWHVFFSQRPEEHVFAAEVESAIELTLRRALDTARCWESGVAISGPDILGRFKLEHDLSAFDARLWRTGNEISEAMTDAARRRIAVRSLLSEAYTAEEQLVSAASVRLQALLAAPSRLAPHFALYLAFLRQMRLHAQTQLNTLTGQHLDLFYRSILEEKPAAPVPDRAYVAFCMAEGTPAFQLPAGTQLVAKDAAGQPLLYALEEAVDMAGQSIGQLQTVITYPATPSQAEKGLAGLRVHCTHQDPLNTQPWPMFGTVPAADVLIGETGFAVASPCLQLAGGERQVSLRIVFQVAAHATELKFGESGPQEAPRIARVGQTPTPKLKFGESGPQEKAGVEVLYSGAESWVRPGAEAKSRPLELTLIKGDHDQIVAKMVFKLGPEDPPCVRFDPKKLKGSFDAGSAVLKILQRNEAGLTPHGSVHGAFLWLLKEGSVAGMTLEVGVKHAPLDSLANDLGVIPPGVPILPFGFAPVPSTAFYLTYGEIKERPLQKLVLHLKWQNLPVDPLLYPDGLVDYYSEYAATMLRQRPDLGTRPFRSAEYLVAVDFKVGDSWKPLSSNVLAGGLPTANAEGEGDVLPLFQPAAPVDPALRDPTQRHTAYCAAAPDPEVLAPDTQLSFVFAKGPNAPGMALPGYSGCIRVKLLQPSYAFGHAIYSQVLTDVALRNAETLMRIAQHDADSKDQIFDRWKVPVKGGIFAFITNKWRRYQWPKPLYDMLPAQVAAALVLPEGITAAEVVRVMRSMAKREGYLQRSDMDKVFLGHLDLNPKEDHDELLVAVYRWFDRLLGRVPLLQPLPPPPLTPMFAEVTVSYQASAAVSFDAAAEGQPARCHQLLPSATPTLLMHGVVSPPLISRIEAGGCLYVGVKNVASPQTISLLFVLTDQRECAVGVAAADAPEWSVLCHCGWVPLSATAHTLNDLTYGLQKSGRVQVSIPKDVDDQSPLMPPGLCWLRIQTQKPKCFPAVSQILVQSGVGVKVPSPSAGDVAAEVSPWQPLAVGSLNALQPPDPRVKSILQPLPSHGGRAGESEPQFLARVSERLRHKGRAWTAWDYERLLLQQFPGIFYARCLAHTCVPGTPGFDDPSLAPGHVVVVVVPLLPQPPSVLPPVFATAELLEMESWLRERASPVVKLHVCNPVYETLQITLRARFDGSLPLGAAQARLNRDLQEHFSPWIYRPESVQLPPSEFELPKISAFVKSRPYVKVLHECAFGSSTQGMVEGDTIRPSHAWSMLVMTEAHHINLVTLP